MTVTADRGTLRPRSGADAPRRGPDGRSRPSSPDGVASSATSSFSGRAQLIAVLTVARWLARRRLRSARVRAVRVQCPQAAPASDASPSRWAPLLRLDDRRPDRHDRVARRSDAVDAVAGGRLVISASTRSLCSRCSCMCARKGGAGTCRIGLMVGSPPSGSPALCAAAAVHALAHLASGVSAADATNLAYAVGDILLVGVVAGRLGGSQWYAARASACLDRRRQWR